MWLFSRSRLEFRNLVAMDDVADLYRAAAHLAVFDVGLTAHRRVQHHRDLFTAIRTSEKVFHSSHFVLTYQEGSCKHSREQGGLIMKYRVYGTLAVAFGAFLAATPLFAHHEILAKFDDKKPTTIKGSVTKIDWANPHVHIFMNVGTGANVANWAVELESPVDLGKAGWTRDSVKPGDALTVQGLSARNGTRQVWANSVVMTNGNKKVFDMANAPKPSNAPGGPTPRWPDNQPRLGPAPGQTGYWAQPQ